MSLLTGPKIEREVANKRITIDPYNIKATGPNSHDLTLAPRMLIYSTHDNFAKHPQAHCQFGSDIVHTLDVGVDNPTAELKIGPEGIVLMPGVLYLASTAEVVGSNYYAATVEGKSSLGRLGLQVHMAGFIDCGFLGPITLEITVVHPLRVRASMRIGQVCFSELSGEVRLYQGKYKGAAGVESSRAWKDFKEDANEPKAAG